MPEGSQQPTPDERVEADHEKEKIERLRRAMYSRAISPNLKDRPRRDLSPEVPLVSEDWVRPEPVIPSSIVAPRGIGFMRGLMKFLVGAAIAFFLGAIGFFAYYFVLGGGSGPVSPGNIDISVSGPLQIASGEPVQLQVAVVNRNRMALQSADLVVKYPPGTRLPSDPTVDRPDQRIPLGLIEPGGRRQGTVSAIFAGTEGGRGSIAVELEYRLEGSSAIFVANNGYEFLFASSPLAISVEGNTEAIGGQPIELKIVVASNADAPVRDALFSAEFPFGFSLTDAEPSPIKQGEQLWSLGDIAPGQRKEIILRGTLAGETNDERVFRFSAGTRTNAEEKTLSTTLADYAHRVAISRPFLDLSVLVNREPAPESGFIATPGSTVNVTVAWRNNLPTTITDAIVVARLTGVEIDGSTVRSTDGFYRSTDRSMLWDKTTSNALASVPGGANGTLNFSFQVPSGETIEALRDPTLTLTVNAAGRRVSEAGVPESLQSSVTQLMRFGSSLALIAEGLYYANPFGSTGPMPPKAGEETTYALVLNLTNSTNRIENAAVKFTLPLYVRWLGIRSPGSEQIDFNVNDSTVTWRVGTLEPGVGVGEAQARHAAIAIGFTPSTSQVGQQPPLVRNITLTGIDSATGAPVSVTAPDVSTNLKGDPGFTPANATVVK